MDDFDFGPEFIDELEDEVVEKYRNWSIRKDVGGQLYIGNIGEETYCTDLKDAHKEIDKKIKKWNKERGYSR